MVVTFTAGPIAGDALDDTAESTASPAEFFVALDCALLEFSAALLPGMTYVLAGFFCEDLGNLTRALGEPFFTFKVTLVDLFLVFAIPDLAGSSAAGVDGETSVVDLLERSFILTKTSRG